jgi:hypothetical protein
MPPLTVHTAVAKQVADRLRVALIDDQRGSLYLGSTAPDIRVLTRWDRERTHFFDLHTFDEQDGVAVLLETHPDLAEPSQLAGSTASFIAGYITHLVMDQMWINNVYRPYFGERSPLGGDVRANVMDRALQFSMDSERRNDRDLMLHVMNEVAACDLDLNIGFIDGDTLRQWHGFVVQLAEQMPDWDRYRAGARRHLERSGVEVGPDFEELMNSLPDLVDEALRYLTPELVESYIEESAEECVRSVRDYLECE